MDYQKEGNCVICGTARFSALSQGLVRLEWSAEGKFENRPTVQAIARSEPIPFQEISTDSEGILHLKTELIHITYQPNSVPFSDVNLKITWQCGDRCGTWHPSTIDFQNLGGTFTSLDLIHRNWLPKGVHPASVGLSYSHAQQWLYTPLKSIHRHLRERGETTHFEEPPLWYLERFRQSDLTPQDQEHLQQWHHFPPGLLSRSGYSVLNDSASAPIVDGWISDRDRFNNQDWYFFAYGLDYSRALADFVQLCGRIPMLPRWAFGIWFSLYDELSEEDYRQLLRQFEELNLPLDVLILDVDWHLWGWCGWDWNQDLLPNPRQFLQWVHQLGLHVGANVHLEGLPPSDSHFSDLCRSRGLDPEAVKAGRVFAIENPTADWIFEPWHVDGIGSYKPTEDELEEGWLLFNLARQSEARPFMEQLHRPREEDGIDFWWIDGSNATHAGVNAQLWTNHVYYTHLESQRDRRALILSRTGGIGSHRYPIQFSADTYSHWEVLQFLVEFTARSGNVGVAYWSHDLGGFFNQILGVPYIDPELFVRWVQFGCWTPIVRLHSDHGRREPWAYGRKVLEAIRRAFHNHVQFLPYFYHLSYIAYQKGLPLCRPLYLNYPKDEEAYQALTQYMLGDFILVAPVVESGGNRSVYLPAGNWRERETETPYSGCQHLNLFVPIDRVPVFVKSGSILPLQPVALRVGNAPPNLLILEVYVGASGELDFYEDDGESLDYRSKGGSQRLFRLDSEGEYHRLSCDRVRGSYREMSSERDFQIRWIGLKKVYRVEAQGVAIASRQWVGNRLEMTLKNVPQAAKWSVVITT
ncbi:alpha-glucosidase [Hydrococcus rivularis NIES-593]|uniref:Alpha-glucosidase n=1 Tax=Hydrococcus rivularis NIES-593 TaxID=1921803 RepID=A0A1U7HRE7_9CYAN|nr:TIM-barrel domain-containing protein [Hydrococcus rivularis]OKH26118.1 alpha-glucosidase [Hydrococcus rivularis NIES-593]